MPFSGIFSKLRASRGRSERPGKVNIPVFVLSGCQSETSQFFFLLFEFSDEWNWVNSLLEWFLFLPAITEESRKY